MNGGLTVVDLETLKAKATACDEALAYLKGRCDSEPLMAVELILLRPGSARPLVEETARRCAEMVKGGADIQRAHAEECRRSNRWTDKEMSVSESGTEAYLTAANALDFWEYQIRREFNLDESRIHFPVPEGPKAEGLTAGNSDEGATG